MSRSKPEVILELSRVDATYADALVVRSVSLVVCRGEVVCLLGPNGAGKTTLLRLISGVMAKQKGGEIRFEGQPLPRPTHRRVWNGIVHVPEGRANIIPTLSVADNLKLAGARLPAVKLAERIDEVCELFPALAGRTKQTAGTMSGGEQQMLAIALGWILSPRLLMVDEPSAGLAPVVVNEVFDRLQLLRERGVSMLIAEQRVDLAIGIADRGYVLEVGQIVVEGSATKLRQSPELESSYLGVTP